MSLLAAFLLSLKFTADANNSHIILQKSHEMPVFLLMFSPYCGHCIKVHPVWEELMKKYESSKDIMIAEIDCVNHREQCKPIFSATGWPTFLTIVKGKATQVRPTRTLEFFSQIVDQLVQRDYSVPCLVYPLDFAHDYPAFVLAAHGRTNAEVCKELKTIEGFVPAVENRMFYVPQQEAFQTEYVAFLNTKTMIDYEGTINIPEMVKWTHDLSMMAFGQWRLDDGLVTTRRFGFMVTSDVRHVSRFKSAVGDVLKDVLIGKIDEKEFTEKEPNVNISAPALVLSDREKRKFAVVNNISSDKQLREILQAYIDGEWDEKMDTSLDNLFPESSREKVYRPVKPVNVPKKNSKKLISGGIKVLIGIIGVGLFVAVASTLVMLRGYTKQE